MSIVDQIQTDSVAIEDDCRQNEAVHGLKAALSCDSESKAFQDISGHSLGSWKRWKGGKIAQMFKIMNRRFIWILSASSVFCICGALTELVAFFDRQPSLLLSQESLLIHLQTNRGAL